MQSTQTIEAKSKKKLLSIENEMNTSAAHISLRWKNILENREFIWMRVVYAIVCNVLMAMLPKEKEYMV